jgi:virulence factor
MADDKFRIAVIGAGTQANQAHYPALAAMDDVEIAAICDLNEERLNETADRYGVGGRYVDYRRMLSEVAPDAVYVIMEVHVLYDVVYHALTNGFNVFIEKPPFLTQMQAESMARLAEKHGCLTMVGFERRFVPLITEARRLVEEQGPILQARAAVFKNHLGMEFPYHRGSIDMLTTDGVHLVDWLRWACGGEVKEVVSDVRRLYAEYDNCFNALIRFENGAVGDLMANWTAGPRQWLFEMHGKGISAYVNATGSDSKAVIYTSGEVGGDWEWRRSGDAFELGMTEVAGSADRFKWYGFYAESRHFIECIREGRQPQPNFADGVKTMQLIDRIYHGQI